MLTGTSSACSPRNGWTENHQLRPGVLYLGGLIGWDARAVGRFAAAVAGCPWPHCGREDLLQILFAHGALAHRVRATQARLPGLSGAGRRRA